MAEQHSRRTHIFRWTLTAVMPVLFATFVVYKMVLITRARKSPELKAKLVRLTDDPGRQTHPAISRAGAQVLYVEDGDLFVRPDHGTPPVSLTAGVEAPATEPAWSPDGEKIAFVAGGAIQVMSIAQAERPARRLVTGGHAPSWAPDNKRLAYSTRAVGDPSELILEHIVTNGELWVVDSTTGQTAALLTGRDAVTPDWSPNGEWIAFVDGRHGEGGIFVLPAAGGEPRKVRGPGAWSPRWSRDGKELLFLTRASGGSAIEGIPLDPETGQSPVLEAGVEELPRDPVKLRLNAASGMLWHLSVAPAAKGRRWALATAAPSVHLYTVELESKTLVPRGEPRAITTGKRRFAYPDFSPGGEEIAFAAMGETEEIFAALVDGTKRRRLGEAGSFARSPRWTANGERMIYADTDERNGHLRLSTIAADSKGSRTSLGGQSAGLLSPVLSPDGKAIAVSDRAGRVLIIELDAPWEAQIEPARARAKGWIPTSWSPDGRWLAVTNGQGIGRLAIERGEVEELTPGHYAVWAADSRRLLIAEQDRVVTYDSETRHAVELLKVAPGQISELPCLALSPDGETLLIAIDRTETTIWLVDFVKPEVLRGAN